MFEKFNHHESAPWIHARATPSATARARATTSARGEECCQQAVALATLGVRRFSEPGYRHGRRAGGGALLVGVPAGLQSSPALTATGCSDS